MQEYTQYLISKGTCSKASLNLYSAYNGILLEWAGEKPFKSASYFDESLPKYLSEHKNTDEEPYSSSYAAAVCAYARRFFYWARDHCKGYKNITSEWIDSIIPVRKIDEVKEIDYYTLDEVKKICTLEPENLNEQRTIAALAFLLLSGMRIAAFFTLPINNVRFDGDIFFVRQSPKDGVCTKYNKAATTTTFKCPPLMKVVKEWDELVRSKCPGNTSWYARLDQSGNFDPREITPMTVENADELKAKARNPYKNFCSDLKKICKKAGVEYKSPHKARYGHIHLGMSKAKTAEQRKAVSLNVIHGGTGVTDEIYMRMNSNQVSNIYSEFSFEEPEKKPSTSMLSDNPLVSSLNGLDPDTLMTMSKLLEAAASAQKNIA